MTAFKASSARSQSSVQLLGYIESCMHVDIQETTDEGELRVKGYETLLNTSTSVLSCIQVLRRIIREYAYGRMGRELQHLSLTVASFERVLYTFIKEEIIIASKKYAKQPPIDFRHKGALKDIIPLIPTDERYTILSGGVASLLHHATKSLNETRQVLEELQSSYDPNREKRWSLSSFVLLSAVFFLYKRFSKRTSFKDFLRQVFPSSQAITWGIGIIVCVDYWKRFMYRFSNLRRIKIHHSRVLMALRLFLLCQHVLQRARPMTNGSDHRLLIDSPMESDIDDDLKNATTLLVERVPLPSEYYDRSSEPPGFTAFKIGTNVLTASSAFAHSVLGKNNKTLLRIFGPALLVMAIPYYAIRNVKAARYTARILIDHPDVDVIRLGWRLFGESRLVKFITKLQCPKLPVLKEQFVRSDGTGASKTRENESDIGIYVFSARPMASAQAGTWTGACTPLTSRMIACGLPTARPVLLYIHGGGFFGRFIAKDMYNLTHWAIKLGAVIVYVDYGLAPETQYPNSLNQCASVYKWILDGGLGFRPGKVALFGESAGGNIAAALCLKCIQQDVKLPSGNVFMFPALNMHLSPSPSRFLHQSDPVLPRGILELALNSYYPHHGHSNQYKFNIHDPLVSPGLAEDGLLAKFPPTSLVVGDLDPLLDDSVDFYTRLSHLRVQSSLKIYPGLSHGFLIYGDLVPEAQKAIDESCDRVQTWFLLH
uniref:Alpha/beta hydrolase fold-3 domain-containing protein n=1 Tax=Globisporangium ultimum (strain ATCC 200006 / CBS 805.95 / DAOM BR144) TaxID=431595 RepID=K3X0C1_GLOUD